MKPRPRSSGRELPGSRRRILVVAGRFGAAPPQVVGLTISVRRHKRPAPGAREAAACALRVRGGRSRACGRWPSSHAAAQIEYFRARPNRSSGSLRPDRRASPRAPPRCFAERRRRAHRRSSRDLHGAPSRADLPAPQCETTRRAARGGGRSRLPLSGALPRRRATRRRTSRPRAGPAWKRPRQLPLLTTARRSMARRTAS